MVSPSFSLSSSSSMTIRTTTRCLESNSRIVSYQWRFVVMVHVFVGLGLSTGYEPTRLLLYHHCPCLRTVQTVIRALFTLSTPTHAPSRGEDRRYLCSLNPHRCLGPSSAVPMRQLADTRSITLSLSHHPHKHHRQHPCRLLQS